ARARAGVWNRFTPSFGLASLAMMAALDFEGHRARRTAAPSLQAAVFTQISHAANPQRAGPDLTRFFAMGIAGRLGALLPRECAMKLRRFLVGAWNEPTHTCRTLHGPVARRGRDRGCRRMPGRLARPGRQLFRGHCPRS